MKGPVSLRVASPATNSSVPRLSGKKFLPENTIGSVTVPVHVPCLPAAGWSTRILKKSPRYPGIPRGTDKWNHVYKIRTYVERSIIHIKNFFCLAGRKTPNEKTLHADLILAGITQLSGVVLADKIHKRECIRMVKSLIA